MMYNHNKILPEENWVNKLYGPVAESMIFINMLQEVEHAEVHKTAQSGQRNSAQSEQLKKG